MTFKSEGRGLLGALVLTVGALGVAGEAGAVVAGGIYAGQDCTIDSFEHSTACEGIYTGNDSSTNLDGAFGVTGWTQLLKIDAPAETGSGGPLTLEISPAGATSGTWTLTAGSFLDFDNVMVALKGGDTFSLFNMTGVSDSTGMWDTLSLLSGGQNPTLGPGLSHTTIYTAEGGPGPGPGGDLDPIPVPAALPLLATALGAGGLVARRRRKRG